MKKIVSYGLYPFLLATVVGVTWLSVRLGWDYGGVYWKTTLFLLAVLITAERLYPLSREWSMTGRSFLRDLKYILLDAPTIGLTKAAFGYLMIRYSESHTGPFSHAPALAGTVAVLVTFEFFQYWFHRLSHEARGPAGRFLWRVHVAHHLPDKVYVLMHAVFNPINAILSTAIIQSTLMLLGVPPAAALASALMIDLQSLVSHFNVDIRAGFLNYVLIGTESHRFHHSADSKEAGNYGNTLAIWDLVFGTLYLDPGAKPARLGVVDPSSYPDSGNVMGVLALPFGKAGRY
ncbi:MAG: hypothetical protein JWP91_3114 [Fibrobacteres bacterium]|nr:hypothetical protein [Fibrobacterota bacterium]